MSRPSKLYKRVRPAGGRLVDVTAGDFAIGDRASTINIHHGDGNLSTHSPSTLTVHTPDRVSMSGRQSITVTLTPAAADDLAARLHNDPDRIRHRFLGRAGKHTAHDRGRGLRTAGWRGTTLTGASWSSVLTHAPDKHTPASGERLSYAANILFNPTWAPTMNHLWAGDSDRWPDGPHDPITASDLLSLLEDRLHIFSDRRDGELRVHSKAAIETMIASAAQDWWPLARAYCLAPTTWDRAATAFPTAYRQTRTTPTGTAVIITGQDPPGPARLEELDWTAIVSHTDQWERVYGLRFDNFGWPWRLPSVTVRLDLLIASPQEGHRRMAGRLLALNVGDPVPLAGDWPTALEGVHLSTSIHEDITPDAWTMTIGLTPHGSLAGLPSPPVAPRIWDQAGPRTWDSLTTETWNQGVNA